MFNDYELTEWMKLKQQEIEKNAINTWKYTKKPKNSRSLFRLKFYFKKNGTPCINC